MKMIPHLACPTMVYTAFFATLTSSFFLLAEKSLRGQSSDLANYWIGFTQGRNDLPDGQFSNWITNRACITRADGSDHRPIALELVDKPYAWTQFAGWSPDGTKAMVLSLWEDPSNAKWEREHRTFRMTEGWLVDTCLVDFSTGHVLNLSSIERVSIYNTGLFYLPNRLGFGFTPLMNGVSKPYRMDLDGRNKKDASGNGTGFAYGYSASPDGKQISYHENYQVYISNLDGSDKQHIKTGNPFNFVPQWSPDGRWLMFLSGEHYDCHPYLVRNDGTGLRKIADRGGYRGVVEVLKHPDFHSESSDVPVWSIDGKSIFYTARNHDRIELMRVDIEGRLQEIQDDNVEGAKSNAIHQITITPSGKRNYHPRTSPDGRWILFGSDLDGTMQLYVIRTDGSERHQVTAVDANHAAMHGHWRPAP